MCTKIYSDSSLICIQDKKKAAAARHQSRWRGSCDQAKDIKAANICRGDSIFRRARGKFEKWAPFLKKSFAYINI
jgi:hypothetical protein